MRTLKFSAALAATCLGTFGFGAVTGELTDAAYVITVDTGNETLPVDIATAAKNSGKAIWKKGTGTLTVTNNSLKGVTANIHVMEGVWKATGYYTCGQGTGYLSVSNNATLQLAGGDWSSSSTAASKDDEKTRRFHLAGTGYNGLGALYNSGNIRLQFLTLQDDALVTGAGTTLRQDGGDVWLNDHTLTISNNNVNCWFNFVCSSFKTNGHIVVTSGSMQLENNSFATAVTSASTLTVKKDARLAFRQKIGDSPMSLVMEEGSLLTTSLANPTSLTSSDRTIWKGPIRLDGDIPFAKYAMTSDNQGFRATGVVSGDGGFTIKDTLRIWLTNTNNAFKGGVKLIGRDAANLSTLRLVEDGALPADGGALTLDKGKLEMSTLHESGVSLSTAVALPPIVCTSCGVMTQVVDGIVARRTVESLAKSGDGVLNLYGPLAVTGTTSLAGGTLRVATRMPEAITGLKCWYKWVNVNPGKTSGTLPQPSGLTTGNFPYLGVSHSGPAMAYRAWEHVLCGVVYKGYFFVPGDQNVTWNFAVSNTRQARLGIDGTVVIEQWDHYRNVNKELYQMGHFQTSEPVTLTPGWHELYLQFYNNYNSGSGPQGYEANEIAQTAKDGYAERYKGCFWKYNFAAAYNPNCDPTASISSNSADYVAFTSDMLKPELDNSPTAMGYAADDFRLSFEGPLVCAPGTTLDLGDVAPYTPFTVPELTGVMTLTNGALAVTNSIWKLRTSDVLAESPLTLTDGAALTFPEGEVTVDVTDPEVLVAVRRSRSCPILRAAAGSALPANRFVLSTDTAATGWVLRRSANELRLEHIRGMAIIVR